MITYKHLEKQDIVTLTPIMKAAFDQDTKLHTDLMEDGPRGYDTGELLEKKLVSPKAKSMVILDDDNIIGEYTITKNNAIYT